MLDPAPLPLSRLGAYELCRLLATGATSEIYEARRLGAFGFSRRVALKRILPQLASDMQFVRMFCEEARLHAALDHPNLVAVIDFGEEHGELFMAMEFVDGISLGELMGVQDRRRRVELPQALRIVREVLIGLQYVHEACDENGKPLGLVHRDVAPSNVLLSRAGEVKLTDFGIVRSAAAETRTLPGELKGRLGYVSPEQAMGARVDARSDLFSVGVLLAEMLIARPLFSGFTELEVLTSLHAGDVRNLHVHGAHLPKEVLALLQGLLAQRPVERLPSASAAVDMLDRIAMCQAAVPANIELSAYLLAEGVFQVDSDIRARAARAPLVEAAVAPAAAQDESRLSYRVRRPGGTIVGPLSLPRVAEMIATARAGVDSEVSRNGGPFLPVASLSELAQVAARPAYRFFEPIALMATERHALAPSVTPWHLFRAMRERRTGLFCARGGHAQRRFYFVEGALVASSSTEPEELLGAILVELGLATLESIERELENGLLNGVPLGRGLVAAGITGEAELERAARVQCLRRLSRTLTLAEGDLFFVEGARSGELDRPVDPAGKLMILAEALRAAVTEEQARAALERLGNETLVPGRDADVLCAGLGLKPAEVRIIRDASTGRSVSELLKSTATLTADERALAVKGAYLALLAGALLRRRAS